MRRRTTSAVGGALLAIALLTACVPEPAPSPTPTGFASEDEAFAAAEATYRAYIDALNSSSGDAQPTPDANSFLTGSALSESLSVEQQLADSGKRIVGSSQILALRQDSWDTNGATITVCVDYSDVRVLDSSGTDVTPPDRPAKASLQVELVYSDPHPLVANSRVGDLKC